MDGHVHMMIYADTTSAKVPKVGHVQLVYVKVANPCNHNT